MAHHTIVLVSAYPPSHSPTTHSSYHQYTSFYNLFIYQLGWTLKLCPGWVDCRYLIREGRVAKSGINKAARKNELVQQVLQ